jgi:methyltransferase-like protein/ubiquinone/menaquinone biosynthesis C-methylase UbiE
MTGEKQTPYDEVAYPGVAHDQTHPDRLATIAALFGMRPAPVRRCRVLELGCGDGVNLISMAHTLPESEFVGMDLAAGPIGEGVRMIADLGLKNIRLENADLMEFRVSGEPFDYIIAHGLYSWVPEPVRDRLLAICEESLAPNGVAYVSYNAYPGCHIRDMTRRMMLYHVRDIAGPREKITQARSLLKFLSTSKGEKDIYRTILEEEYERATERRDDSLYHDDLSPVNQPFYLWEFLDHASKRNLQFVGEAVFGTMHPKGYTPDALRVLQEMEDDLVTREQYLDFLMCRRFRSTLLCRRDVPLPRKVQPSAISDLYASFDGEAVSQAPDVLSTDAEEFRTRQGASIRTNRPVLKAALSLMSRCWPRAFHFDELLAASPKMSRAESAGDGGPNEDVTAFRDLLLGGYAAGMLELHSWAPPLVIEISERPIASPLARYQSSRAKPLTTLLHTSLTLADSLSRYLIGLLDGTRDFSALADALVARIESGKASVSIDGKPIADPELIRANIEKELRITLQGFARSALLVG